MHRLVNPVPLPGDTSEEQIARILGDGLAGTQLAQVAGGEAAGAWQTSGRGDDVLEGHAGEDNYPRDAGPTHTYRPRNDGISGLTDH